MSICEKVWKNTERRRHVGVQANWIFHGELRKKNKEILLLLVVCTEWSKKQTVLCDLQVANANLKQIIFDSHALQMPKCIVVVLQQGHCTTPPNKGLCHCNPSIEYSTEMSYTESAHGNHDSITYNMGINTTY